MILMIDVYYVFVSKEERGAHFSSQGILQQNHFSLDDLPQPCHRQTLVKSRYNLYALQALYFFTFFQVVSTSFSFSPSRVGVEIRHRRTSQPHARSLPRGLFLAKEAFMRSGATYYRVNGFAAFVTQQEPSLSLAASSSVAKLKTSKAPRYEHPTSHSTAGPLDFEVG